MLLRIIILIGTCIMLKDSIKRIREERTPWNMTVFVVSIAMLITAILLLAEAVPTERTTGNMEYDKEKIIAEYGSDIDSALFVFPDDAEAMIESAFASNLKSGLFDTDGYLILQTKYSAEDYIVEVERLSNVSCSVMDTELSVRYDTESYALPAYVAVDGFDYVYEYALVNAENCEITYVLLCYPEYIDMSEYQEYLKLDMSEYEIEDALNQFSIYARESEDGIYVEYSDEVQ